MLKIIILKLLLKATIPLLLLAGVLSYGLYLQGADPAALWRSVGSGMNQQLANSLSTVAGQATSAMNRARSSADKLLVTDRVSSPQTGTDRVYTWVDEQGVTHFSTRRPDDISTTRMISVNPDTNVLAPVGELQGPDDSQKANSSDAINNIEQQLGEPLPGIAGQILSRQTGNESADTTVMPDTLIKLLPAQSP
ncbi:MAG: DUF4124 domain-containing protein [Granulosicoccus sp.]|nr:DUF4124 domain-containing protein [Granulosicoccus sp.]